MKRRSAKVLDEPTLFDLPLAPPEQDKPEDGELMTPKSPGEAVEPLFGEASSRAEEPTEKAARPLQRWVAGLADLGVLGAALVVIWGGARLLGVVLGTGDLPALVAFLLLFSVFYTVISLAFWGQTPGMAITALRAQSLDLEPVSFQQALKRWLGAVGTLLTGGLLLWPGRDGRSFSDQVSGTRTVTSGKWNGAPL